MSEWQKYRIKNICRINAQTIKKSEIPPLVRYLETSGAEKGQIVAIENIDTTQQTLPSRAQRKVKDKTIVYSMVRPNLEHFAFITSEFAKLIVSTGFCTLDVYAKDVDPLYLFYSLTRTEVTSHLHTIATTNVSSYPALNPDDIGELELVFPKDINEQKRVAALLSMLDRKITMNCTANAELEAMAKLLYEYWFVQFDFPDKNGRPYKSSDGRMEYSPVLKQKIPSGWQAKQISQCVFVRRDSINPAASPNKEFKYYSIPGFDSCGSYLEEKGETIQSNKFVVNKTDILVSKLNPWFNRVVYATADDAIASTEFVVWFSKKQEIQNFMYMLARSPQFIDFCTNAASGTSNSHKRVNPDVMMSFLIPYDESIVEKFGATISSWIQTINNNIEESKQLRKLRDWLLPLLMNGQVKVKKAAQESTSPIAIPAAARSTKKQIDYGLQLVFAALKQSGGYINLNTIADIFAALGSPSEMSGMLPDSEEKSAWQKNMPNLPVNNALLTATIDRLIKYGLVALRTVKGAKELVMIGDWPVEETDDKWIDLDAHLAMQAIANWDERIRIQNQLFFEFRKIFDEAKFAVAA